LESALGSTKIEPRQLKAMADTLYAAQFGSAVDLKPMAALAPAQAAFMAPALIGAGVGLVAGYLFWGGTSQNSQFEQLLMQQWLLSGGGPLPAAPGLRGGIGTAGGVARDIFGICLIIWLSRSQIWEAIFPLALPRGIQLARMLAIPLVIAGVISVLAGTILVTSITALGTIGPTIDGAIGFGGALLLLDATWRYGFWLLIFLLLFSVLENLILRHVRPTEVSQGPRR
jgi:hypothetical protein